MSMQLRNTASPGGPTAETQQNGASANEGPIKRFLKAYIWQGQLLKEEVDEDDDQEESAIVALERKIFANHRKFVGLLSIFSMWQLFWWCLAFRYDFFSLFPKRYYMSLIMILGSLVAGMTPEGGGAVAFPVMTLILHIEPTIARDFSLMIQSCGMTAAACCIFIMKIQLEWHSIFYCSIGGALGVIIGLEFIADKLSPAVKKMMFVSIWFSFAVALFMSNRQKSRVTRSQIAKFTWWHVVMLMCAGFVGGTFTAFAGSGIDICCFAFLTLFFYVSEKVATPTSVVLMAINTVIGFFWRNEMMDKGIDKRAWDYVAVSIPIVTFNAPLGCIIASYLRREVLAWFVYILEIIALVTGFATVRPNAALSVLSVGVIIGGIMCFWMLSKFGEMFYGSGFLDQLSKGTEMKSLVGAVKKQAKGKSSAVAPSQKV